MAKYPGTIVVLPDKRRVIFPEQLTEREAIRQAKRIAGPTPNPVRDPVQDAVDKYAEFNFRAPRELAKLDVDLRSPLIRIGRVPEIHYISDKEGKRTHYVHFVKRKGTLYGHPSGQFFLLVGGSTRIRDWLIEENGPARRRPRRRNPEPDASFVGWQTGTDGRPLFALYNVLKKGHPLYKSTVSEKTLRDNRLQVPETPPPPGRRVSRS